jgi:alpha-amylase
LAGLKPAAPVPPAAVSLVKASQKAVVLVKGTKFTVPAYAYTADGAKVKVTWKSSKPKTAAVSAKGTISAKKAGKATITITAGGKKATVKVTVLAKKPAKKVTKVTAKVPKKIAVGATATITGAYSPARVAKVKVRYKSSAPSVISVDKVGRLVAKQAGKAKITITAGGKAKTYTVTAG